MKTSALLLIICLLFATPVFSLAQEAHPGSESSHHRGHMDHHFDPLESAKSFDDPARDKWQKPAQVLSALGLEEGQAVADIGAGTGYFTVRLARSLGSGKVFAVDIEQGMVDYLRQRAAEEGLDNVVAVHATQSSPNLPEAVDCILIVNTYHHVADRETYFRRLAKSLRPGGRIAIIDFRKDAPSGPPQHFRFTPEEITSEMRSAGYALVAQHDFLPNQEFLIYSPEPASASR